jgi:hypothetical protein
MNSLLINFIISNNKNIIMATFNIAIARSKFNFENNLSKFLREEGLVKLNYFETHGSYKAPKRIKVLINQNNDIKEYYFDLKLNVDNNSYYPHYIGIILNCTNTKLSIIAISEESEELKESISFSIIFENNYNDENLDVSPKYFPGNVIPVKNALFQFSESSI